MGDAVVLISVVTVFVLIALITVRLIVFFMHFNIDTRYIVSEMQRAYDDSEYRYWRRELRCHYLCLIPFVNKKNVMRLYRYIYHKPKHQKQNKRCDGLYHMLAPSLISVVLCAVCLCGVSWAWFSASKTGIVADIQSATYTATVAAKKDNIAGDYVITEDEASKIPIISGSEYQITLKASGTARNGYCKIEFVDSGTVYYTAPIVVGGTFSFTVNASQSDTLKITPQWGETTESALQNNTVITY